MNLNNIERITRSAQKLKIFLAIFEVLLKDYNRHWPLEYNLEDNKEAILDPCVCSIKRKLCGWPIHYLLLHLSDNSAVKLRYFLEFLP